jgi:hypothetical protein
MKTAEAIKTLGTAMGLPALAFDAENTCNLMIDDRQEIYLSGDPDGSVLRMHAVLGDATELRADPTRMLEVNYNADESGGGALSINRITGEVVYVKSLDLTGHDAAGVTSALETFLRYAAFWMEHVGTLSQPVADPRLGGQAGDAETIIRI